MKTRKIGELTVSAVGMGCMAFSHGYGQIPPEAYSIEAIQNAYRHGCTFFDTAEIYSPNLSGTGHNERIVGKALRDVRQNIVLATKLFLDRSEVRSAGSVYDAIHRHLDGSLDRLQTDMVDLYYLHRTNGGVSVEEVAEAMGLLIEDGLIRGWGGVPGGRGHDRPGAEGHALNRQAPGRPAANTEPSPQRSPPLPAKRPRPDSPQTMPRRPPAPGARRSWTPP